MKPSTYILNQRSCSVWSVLFVSFTLAVGCSAESDGPVTRTGTGDQVAVNQAHDSDSSVVLNGAVVEASCGQCVFDLDGSGCDLAIRVDGKAYFVDGSPIDDHGDAHADDGFCNCIRKAKVSGVIEGGRFVAESFELTEGDPE